MQQGVLGMGARSPEARGADRAFLERPTINIRVRLVLSFLSFVLFAMAVTIGAWILLSRLEGAERARVFDSLAALVPPPADVTRAGILRGDAAMRDLWWDELGLGSAGFWRLWTSRWSRGR